MIKKVWLTTFDDGMNSGGFKFAVSEQWLRKLFLEWVKNEEIEYKYPEAKVDDMMENLESWVDEWIANDIYEIASKQEVILDAK